MPVRKDSRGRWIFRHVVELPPDSSGKPQKKRIYGTAPRHSNTKVAAQQAMFDAIRQLHSEARTPERKKEVPIFKDFVEERFMPYTKNRNKHTELRNKRSFFANHLLPVFGHMRLDEIRTLHIEDYKCEKLERGRVRKSRVKPEKRGLSKKSIDNHLILLHRVLSVAKDWEIIDRVPKLELFRPPPPPFDFFDFEEAERLLAAARTIPGYDPLDDFAVGEGDWGRMIVVGIKTGMRIGELIALRKRNVHFHAGVIHVCEAIADGIVGLPKSGKPRDLPMSKAVVEALRAQQQHSRSEYVFCTLDGDPLAYHQCPKPLALACERAGLRRVTWHALRHTFASHLAMRGVPLKAIQELLGHAGMTQTMRYAHLAQSAKQHAVDLLDEPPPSFAAEPKSPWQRGGSKSEEIGSPEQPQEDAIDVKPSTTP